MVAPDWTQQPWASVQLRARRAARAPADPGATYLQRGRAPRVCYIPPRTARMASECGRAKTDRVDAGPIRSSIGDVTWPVRRSRNAAGKTCRGTRVRDRGPA